MERRKVHTTRLVRVITQCQDEDTGEFSAVSGHATHKPDQSQINDARRVAGFVQHAPAEA